MSLFEFGKYHLKETAKAESISGSSNKCLLSGLGKLGVRNSEWWLLGLCFSIMRKRDFLANTQTNKVRFIVYPLLPLHSFVVLMSFLPGDLALISFMSQQWKYPSLHHTLPENRGYGSVNKYQLITYLGQVHSGNFIRHILI